MELSVDTFLKSTPEAKSDVVGRTTITVDEEGFRQLEKLEESLKSSGSEELLAPVHEAAIQAEVPADLGEIRDQKVRIFLGEDGETGQFHLVAKRVDDEALVYTEPTIIRLIAV